MYAKKKIHIIGMGVVGSILARHLHEQGIEFSWFNEDKEFTAWKASTGCIYPSGDELDNFNYERFPESAKRLGINYEEALYSFTQKSIPHHEGDKSLQVISQDGLLKFVNKPSYHINVQELVKHTREKFIGKFRTQAPEGSFVIHAHGFHGAMQTDYRWGWSCEATLQVPQREVRICFNLKEGRFNNSYIYPKPGTEKYYFGTHFIYQRAPKHLETLKKAEKILEHVNSVLPDSYKIRPDFSTIVEGWRPAFTEPGPCGVYKDGEFYIRPQMANGLRHHVSLLYAIDEHIQGYFERA